MLLMLRLLWVFHLLTTLCASSAPPATKVDMSSNWTLVNSHFNISVANLTLPTSVHTALREADLIDDPLYRFNDVNLRWIVDDDGWMFVKQFTLDNFATLNATTSIDLQFSSIDTLGSVYLNGMLVLSAQSQFLAYELPDINSQLKSDANIIEVRFDSPIVQANATAAAYPYAVPAICPPDVQHGECHVNFLRKEQSSFSWDWGPAFAPIALGPVALNLVTYFDFDVYLSVYPSDSSSLDEWTLDIELDIRVSSRSNQSQGGLITFSIQELNFSSTNQLTSSVNDDTLRFSQQLNRKDYDIALWWPLGYGEQKLYNFTVHIVKHNLDDESITHQVNKSKLIGFRSVELVQDEVRTPGGQQQDGLTFAFRVNGVATYLKGSNWIPADSFQELVTDEYVDWLVRAARDANINVLRVWGGGVYEREQFYALADRYGIMIWQDMMFACSLYPTDEAFLVSVSAEIAYQIQRLRSHPSIIVWSGNNENEAAMAQHWWPEIRHNETLYADDYRRLYIDVVMKTLVGLDPEVSRPFVSSSPSNGKESEAENWLAKNPGDVHYGDIHYYDYTADGWRAQSFPIGRMMSEFGVQSMSSYATLADVFDMPADAEMFGALNMHRQHHEGGNQQIVDQIQRHFRVPNASSESDKVSVFKAIIYLSQVNQAMWLKTGTELYRRNRDLLNSTDGTGLCSGTMYWQFNDIWQAPTWSSLERVTKCGGKWKMAHYHMKHAYASVILSFSTETLENDNQFEIYAVSDLHDRGLNDTFALKVFAYESLTPLYAETLAYSVGPFVSKPIARFDIAALTDGVCSFGANYSCLVVVEPTADSLFDYANFLFLNDKFDTVSNMRVPQVRIISVAAASSASSDSGQFSIVIGADAVALFVWLDVETSTICGTFSDNGFHMTSSTRTLTYQTDTTNVTVDDISRYLSVKSLLNIY